MNVTIALSRKVSDGAYGSFSATIGLEDELPKGTDRDSFAAGLRVWCKTFLDETLGDMREEYLQEEAIAQPYVEDEVQTVPLTAEAVERAQEIIKEYREEKPPLPSDETLEAAAEALAPIYEAGEEVRTPIDDAGQELKSFKVDYFIIHESDHGSKYAKVHGGPVRKWGASAWGEVMEALVDISDLDVGQKFDPPYPVNAFCTTSEKGFPNKVMYFERA